MPSQTDFDQGGTTRQMVRRYLGPSIGWVETPGESVLPITSTGTYFVLPGVTLVTINVNASVTINLPSAVHPSVPAGVLPGRYTDTPITIIDIGGFGAANAYLINAAAGENIIGLSGINLSTNFGGYTLKPSSTQAGWDMISP